MLAGMDCRPLSLSPVVVLVALWCVLGAGVRRAEAQYDEYRLGPNGEWVQTRAPDPNSPEALIAQARKFLAEDQPEQAHTLLDRWIKQVDRSGSPWLPEALALRGDAKVMKGDEYQALYDYERVIKEFAGSDQFVVAVERELDIGVRYVNGYDRKFAGIRMLPADDVGEELLIRVQERMPGSRLGERAGIELADYYYRKRDLELASEAYRLFLENYPSSQYHLKAMQRRVYATIARYKGPRYDGSALLDSVILIRRFQNLYPQAAEEAGLDEALLSRIDESAGAELYESARWYLAQKDEAAARYVLNRLIRERPKTAAASEAYRFLERRGWLADMTAPVPREEVPAEVPEELKEAETAPVTKEERPAETTPGTPGEAGSETPPAVPPPAPEPPPSALPPGPNPTSVPGEPQ